MYAALNLRRRKTDVKVEVSDDQFPKSVHDQFPNIQKDVWSPLDFDRKYTELARELLGDYTDEAA